MSRSRKKTPITGNCKCRSERRDKQEWHSRFRSAVKQVLAADPIAEIYPHEDDIGNVWSMAKDGKRPFNPKEYPKGMRK